VEAADAALRSRLQSLAGSLPGGGFVACKP
jgi:hypothetical protein